MADIATVSDPAVTAPARPVVSSRVFFRRFAADKAALVGLIVLGLIIIAAVAAPLIARYDPAAQEIADRLQGPSGKHWLGTDELGRDTFSRLVHGARVSLLAGPFATLVGIVIGAPAGIFVGFRRGAWDAVGSRIADALMSLPPLILAIAAIAVFGPGVRNAMIAIGVVLAPRFYRVMRASAERISRETYIEASRTIGCSTWRILRAHVLPGVMAPLVIQASLAIGLSMLGEIALSFIGLGVQPPDPSWGAMLGGAYQYTRDQPLLIIIPGLAVLATVLSVNFIGEGVRGALSRETSHVR